MNEFTLRRMTRTEVDGLIEWAAREGWNPGLHDADAFWAIDPQAFFAGVVEGRIVACGAAFCYDDHFAFCGLYIVEPAFRGRGLGLALTQARLEYIGHRNAGLDGVLTMVDRYERLGYRRAHRSTRFTFTPQERFPVPVEVVPTSQVDLGLLADYDARHFPARRERFLAKWLTQPGAHALALVKGGTIEGYGVLRPVRQGFKIGPLFAVDGHAAESLLGALCNQAQGSPVYLDVPEPNGAGLTLAQRWGMEPVFACERMYRRGDPGLPLENIFGITTFEAG